LTMRKEGVTRKRTTGMARGQRGRRRLSKSVRFRSLLGSEVCTCNMCGL
jgi:hypothetical protein